MIFTHPHPFNYSYHDAKTVGYFRLDRITIDRWVFAAISASAIHVLSNK